jgi:serine/alanine adding enzyme
MTNSIKVIQMKNHSQWDSYVDAHEKANPYHLMKWQHVIKSAYRHKTYALAAINENDSPDSPKKEQKSEKNNISGILPLVHMNDFLFGNRLVSMPFVDHGGLLADTPFSEKKLIEKAVLLARELKADHIELRHLDKINCLDESFPPDPSENGKPFHSRWSMKASKVRMVMPLPDSSDALMKSFKSKLRSQINRPIKAGLETRIGGIELLEEFYRVFVTNMRDLGSPVHSKMLPRKVMEQFSDTAKIVLIHHGTEPFAAGIMLGFKDVMINPWASALRQHSNLSPNMLLYYSMLGYACDHGYRYFDFGRSTPEEGSYRFKSQWGAQPKSMYWYTLWLKQPKNLESNNQDVAESTKRDLAATFWSRLPVPISKILGPMIRKHIDL